MAKRKKRKDYKPAMVKAEIYRQREALMCQRALSGGKPANAGDIVKLKISSYIVIEENITNLFPMIIEMVVQGDSIAKIELMMYMKQHILRRFLNAHPKLNRYVKAAKAYRKTRDYLDRDYEDVLSNDYIE